MNGLAFKPTLLLFNQKLISEFMLIENDVSKKEEYYAMPIGQGFVMAHGKRAMFFRGIISKCFHYEQLTNFTPEVYKILMKHINQMLEEFDEIEEEFPYEYT